jgi:hypothetical protein
MWSRTGNRLASGRLPFVARPRLLISGVKNSPWAVHGVLGIGVLAAKSLEQPC